MDFVWDSFKFLSKLCHFFVFLFGKGIKILLMSNFLLFFGYFKRPEILFEFSSIETIFIFNIFKSNFILFFELGELI